LPVLHPSPQKRGRWLMKRMVFAVAVALVMAVMLAPGALAQEAVADENCTFEKGKTTCTESIFVRYEYDRTEIRSEWNGSYYQNVCYFYHYDAFETTTTVYKGKSEKVLSTSTRLTQGEPYVLYHYPR
jgi:hypothetical protein